MFHLSYKLQCLCISAGRDYQTQSELWCGPGGVSRGTRAPEDYNCVETRASLCSLLILLAMFRLWQEGNSHSEASRHFFFWLRCWGKGGSYQLLRVSSWQPLQFSGAGRVGPSPALLTATQTPLFLWQGGSTPGTLGSQVRNTLTGSARAFRPLHIC